jgi:hypothetical protein
VGKEGVNTVVDASEVTGAVDEEMELAELARDGEVVPEWGE